MIRMHSELPLTGSEPVMTVENNQDIGCRTMCTLASDVKSQVAVQVTPNFH